MTNQSNPHALAGLARKADEQIGSMNPLLDGLEEALGREAKALASRDALGLLDAVEQKKRMLGRLELAIANSAISHLIDEQLRGASETSLSRRKEQLADLIPAWPAFVSKLTHCQLMNRATGASTVSLLRNTNDLLSLLGFSSEPAEYDPGGSTQNSRPASRPIVC